MKGNTKFCLCPWTSDLILCENDLEFFAAYTQYLGRFCLENL